MTPARPSAGPPLPHAPSLARLRMAVLLCALLPMALLCTLAAHMLASRREHHERSVELLARNLSGALERTLSLHVGQIDGTLRSVADLL